MARDWEFGRDSGGFGRQKSSIPTPGKLTKPGRGTSTWKLAPSIGDGAGRAGLRLPIGCPGLQRCAPELQRTRQQFLASFPLSTSLAKALDPVLIFKQGA